MSDYYSEKLSAQRLMRCYEIAPPRVRQYLDAELNYVLEKVQPDDLVLELGCGYGRIIPEIARKAQWVVGIDISHESLLLGRKMIDGISHCSLVEMNATCLAFSDQVFDLTICIQNGISAFHVDQRDLIQESIRVTKADGKVLFSTYSNKFWEDRIEWFQMQSDMGLLGEIDYEKTHDGTIVCRDGFTATTVSPSQFLSLSAELDVETVIVEVDRSSLFCEISLPPSYEQRVKHKSLRE